MIDRTQILWSLVEFDRPIHDIIACIKTYSWDSDDCAVILSCASMAKVLRKFVNGNLTQDDVELWANVIESREDIDFDQNHEEVISQAIFELANPTLTSTLTKDSAQELISKIDPA